MPRFIGIHGKAGSGKTELALIFTRLFGFKQLAIASKIKEIAGRFFSVEKEDMYGSKKKDVRAILQGIGTSLKHPIETIDAITFEGSKPLYPEWVYSHAMDYFGVPPEVIRSRIKFIQCILSGIYSMHIDKEIHDMSINYGSNIWVEYLLGKTVMSTYDDCVYVISDVRLKDEFDRCIDLDSKMVKVIREGLKPKADDHFTETDLDLVTGWDYIITNYKVNNWKSLMITKTANIVRDLHSIGFFTENDTDKFKITL